MVDRSSLTEDVEEIARVLRDRYPGAFDGTDPLVNLPRPGNLNDRTLAILLLTALEAAQAQIAELEAEREDFQRMYRHWAMIADQRLGASNRSLHRAREAQARAEKAEASLVEAMGALEPIVKATADFADPTWDDGENVALECCDWVFSTELTVLDFRRASDVHSRLLEGQFAENAKCSGLLELPSGVGPSDLTDPQSQRSDGGRDV